MSKDSNLTIVIPCFNEEESLREFIAELLEYSIKKNYKVIIVNDGSIDKTKEILNELKSKFDFTLINHKLNKGYGAALKTGIENVKTEFVITIDADAQHYLDDIEMLFDNMLKDDADMIVGSRQKASGSVYRGIGKWLIRRISKLLVPLKIFDINSGMKIYRSELVRKYLDLCPDTMAFSDIITLVFISQRHFVKEYPIKIKKRKVGKSTINFNTAMDTLIEIINIVMLFNPLRIFLPLTFILILLGIGWGIPIVLAGKGVSVGGALLIIMGVLIFLLGLIAEQFSILRKRK